jgi:RNA polymerase sigma-70 factor, ECF subfamily
MSSSVLEELLVHRETVFRVCLGFTRNYTEAEDLAQEVYIKAMAAFASIRHTDRSREWLLRIARNTCLDHQKQRRVRSRLLSQWASETLPPVGPAPAAGDDAEIRAVKKAMALLPRRLRDVFVMREYAELSYAEIGRSLGLKDGTVMSRLNRARAFITRKVKENAHG